MESEGKEKHGLTRERQGMEWEGEARHGMERKGNKWHGREMHIMAWKGIY
jgi:hypothetical protein